MSQEELKESWLTFGDIPVNEDETIDEPFDQWPAGTDRFVIWHWFDEHYNGGVYKLLFPKQ